ncbi:MxaD family protein [Prauserella sp. PE36]|uniref:SRPBCC family protein n=1 Tax=Prauserella endophytica TaxID=1592324 RepID=A0ABY2SC87_9PSEU|nr:MULTISPECIES: SRPBCC family protein [Prauserella]PXY34997.1 hypothetical protein BAY59_05870 [Prauserella coralliicola]RBM19211.1 MxaD family protein [Prauserella sp. PE36]TKG73523.1 SRPBCC family protein [Prauserella endophytica]
MPRWFPLTEADDEFVRTAPVRFEHVVDLPAPPSVVWRVLTADDALASWSRLVTRAEWTSPRPLGPGATRLVTLGGALTLEERFYRWEEERRMTFTVDRATGPGLRRFAEDLALDAVPGGTRLRWTFASEPVSSLVPAAKPAAALLRRVTAGLPRGLARRVEEVR